MKTLTQKIDLTRPDIDERLSAEGRKQNNYTFPIAVAIFLAVCFIGVFAYYSEKADKASREFLAKEYGSQSINPEVNIAGHIKEYPEHCGKLEFKSREAAKKLGC